MKFTDFQHISTLDEFFIPDGFSVEEFTTNLCSVDGMVAFPLTMVSKAYKSDNEYDIVDVSGNEIATLCIYPGSEFDISSSSNIKYLCYLQEISPEYYNFPYKYRSNYLVIKKSNLDDYFSRFSLGSSIWGGFDTAIVPSSLEITPLSIIARENIELPSDLHYENIFRGLAQPHAFERFLKSYHLLELHFDQDIVNEI